jgi:hypothetical protein
MLSKSSSRALPCQAEVGFASGDESERIGSLAKARKSTIQVHRKNATLNVTSPRTVQQRSGSGGLSSYRAMKFYVPGTIREHCEI